MNRLNKAESAIFIHLLYSLFPKDLTIQNLFTYAKSEDIFCESIWENDL